MKAAPELDADIRRFIEAVAAAAAAFPDPHQVPYPEAREFLEEVRRPWTQGGPAMHATRDAEVPTRAGPVRVRIHDPSAERPKPALVYLHGGGWTFFSVDTHDRVMREYAAQAGVVVVGVDYALSPEHKYPTALNQVLDVIGWLRARGTTLGVDPHRLALGGDSAGANLAVAAALESRDAGEGLAALLLNYGAYDERLSEAAHRYGGPGYMLGSDEMRAFWHNYVRSPAEFADPLVCPLRADLRGLPPVFMAVPTHDLLTEQNRMMAAKFAAAGVPVKAVEYDGASHSFLEAVAIAELSRRAFADAAAWLARRLAVA